MIDFPASPTNGQVFTSGGSSWTYDGTKWVAAGNAIMPPLATGDNRIINGDMRIDQRNNGATFIGQNTYLVDRWNYVAPAAGNRFTWGRNLNGVNGPSGFPYYLGAQTASVYTAASAENLYIEQRVEADQISDFMWGAANAQPVTLSFWAYSSLTGLFSGSVFNYAGTRSYPFTFSIPVANTWAKIVLTIPGDTAGTWVLNGNAGAVRVAFDLGCGANGRGPANVWASTAYLGVTGSVSVVGTLNATFYLTGVKLETGSVATPYNRQSLTKSQADCERYYQVMAAAVLFGQTNAGSSMAATYRIPTMRASPTATLNSQVYANSSGLNAFNLTVMNFSVSAVITATGPANASFNVALSAEL